MDRILCVVFQSHSSSEPETCGLTRSPGQRVHLSGEFCMPSRTRARNQRHVPQGIRAQRPSSRARALLTCSFTILSPPQRCASRTSQEIPQLCAGLIPADVAPCRQTDRPAGAQWLTNSSSEARITCWTSAQASDTLVRPCRARSRTYGPEISRSWSGRRSSRMPTEVLKREGTSSAGG